MSSAPACNGRRGRTYGRAGRHDTCVFFFFGGGGTRFWGSKEKEVGSNMEINSETNKKNTSLFFWGGGQQKMHTHMFPCVPTKRKLTYKSRQCLTPPRKYRERWKRALTLKPNGTAPPSWNEATNTKWACDVTCEKPTNSN